MQLNVKRNEGRQLALEEEILYERLKKQEAVRRRRRQQRAADDSLFVADVGSDRAEQWNTDSELFNDNVTELFDNTETITSNDMKGKPKSNQERIKRPTASSKHPIQDKTARVAKSASKRKRGVRTPLQLQPDLASLFVANVFEDQQSGRAPLPQLTGTRREQALKALVSSLPETERKSAQRDKKLLNEACKRFRKGTLRVVEDGFQLSGLAATLKPHQVSHEERSLVILQY